MTDDQIRAEITKQIHNTLALLATKLSSGTGRKTTVPW
jgi:hypothetical protein